MEAIAARIKAFVLVIYPTILSELALSDAQLDFLVQDVIDRALAFMNREQLVYQFELDLVDNPIDEEINNEFWACYDYPIPPILERTLASTVVGVAKNMQNRNTAATGAIKSISDNGQSVSYADQISNFLSSSSDAEIFSGTLGLLRRYLLPTIVNDHSSILSRGY